MLRAIPPLYFHPSDLNIKDPIFFSETHFEAAKHFLFTLECLEPNTIIDLYPIAELYSQDISREIIAKERETDYSISEWEIICRSNSNACIRLKTAIIEWGNKYHLIDKDCTQPLYLETARWAISNYTEHCSEEYYKEWFDVFLRKFGDVEKATKYYSEWVKRNQVISLVRTLNISSDVDMTDYYDRNFPFAFTPSAISSKVMDIVYDQIEEKDPEYKQDMEDLRQNMGLSLRMNALKYEDLKMRFDEIKYYFEKITSSPDKILYKKLQSISWVGRGWNPQVESWTEFEKEIDEEYRKYKAAYKARTEQIMEERGYKNPQGMKTPVHFEWFVRYQVQGWTMAKIADEYSTADKTISEDAVSKALHKVSKMVLLPLRPYREQPEL